MCETSKFAHSTVASGTNARAPCAAFHSRNLMNVSNVHGEIDSTRPETASNGSSKRSNIRDSFDPGVQIEFHEASSTQALFVKSGQLPSHAVASNSGLTNSTTAPVPRRELTLSPDPSTFDIGANTTNCAAGSSATSGAMRALSQRPTPHSSAQTPLDFAVASVADSSSKSSTSLIPDSSVSVIAHATRAQPGLQEGALEEEGDAGLFAPLLHHSGPDWPPSAVTHALGSLSCALGNTISHDSTSQLSAPSVDVDFDQDPRSEWQSQNRLLGVGETKILPVVRAVTRTYSEDEVGGSGQLGDGGREGEGQRVDDELTPEELGDGEGQPGVLLGDGTSAAPLSAASEELTAPRKDNQQVTPPWTLYGSSGNNEAHLSESSATFANCGGESASVEPPPRAMSFVGARGKTRMLPPPLQITTPANELSTVAKSAVSALAVSDVSSEESSNRLNELSASRAAIVSSSESGSADDSSSSSSSTTSDTRIGREDGDSCNFVDTSEPATPVPRPRGKGGKGTLKLLLLKAESKEFESVNSATAVVPGLFTPPSSSSSSSSGDTSSSIDSLGHLTCPDKPLKSTKRGNKRSSPGTSARRPRAPSLGSPPSSKTGGSGGGMPHGLGSTKKPVPPPQFVSTRPNSKHLFWALVWPALAAAGWHLEPGKRKRDNDYYFIPPNINRETARYRADYFDSVKSVLQRAAADERFATCLQDYEAAEASALAERAAEGAKPNPVYTTTNNTTATATTNGGSKRSSISPRSPRQSAVATRGHDVSPGEDGGHNGEDSMDSGSLGQLHSDAQRSQLAAAAPRAKRAKPSPLLRKAQDSRGEENGGLGARPESPCTPSAFAPPSMVSPTASESGGRSRRAPRKVVKFDPSSRTTAAASTPTLSLAGSAAGAVRASPSGRRSGSNGFPFSPRTRSPSSKSPRRSPAVNHSSISNNHNSNHNSGSIGIHSSAEQHVMWPNQRSGLDPGGLALEETDDSDDVNDALLLPLLDHSDVAFVPGVASFAAAAASAPQQAVHLASDGVATQSYKPVAISTNPCGSGVARDGSSFASSRTFVGKGANDVRSAGFNGTTSGSARTQETIMGSSAQAMPAAAWQPSATVVASLDNLDPFNADIADVFNVNGFNLDFG